MTALEFCLPYEQWTITTLLTSADIAARLEEHIGVSGYIAEDSFSFVRSRSLNNYPTALVTINGKVEDRNSRRIINVKMEMSWLMKGLYAIWLIASCIISLIVIISEIRKNGPSLDLLWALPLLTVFYFIPLIPQKVDRRYAKRYLAGILT